WPPTYRSLPDTASASALAFVHEPSADQFVPFHLAMPLATTSPTTVKPPQMKRLPALSTTAAVTGPSAPRKLGFMLIQLASRKGAAGLREGSIPSATIQSITARNCLKSVFTNLNCQAPPRPFREDPLDCHTTGQ